MASDHLDNSKKNDSYTVQPTNKQIKTVNSIISGEKNLGSAMRSAGYSHSSSLNPSKNFIEAKGTKAYLERLDAKAKQKFNMSTVDRALEAFLDALQAKKYIPFRIVDEGNKVTYKTQPIPDHDIRIRAADKLLKLHNIENLTPEKEDQQASLTKEEINDFNKKFIQFIESSEYIST
jgi:hypothetical protein